MDYNVLYTTERKVYGLVFDNQSTFCLSFKYLPFDEFKKKKNFVTELSLEIFFVVYFKSKIFFY